MSNKRPEREQVEKAFLESPKRRAHEIAGEIGLIEKMGYDNAVSYVRRVKKSMKEKGQLTVGTFTTDEERLQVIDTLFELRDGMINRKSAYFLLLLNCYYRLRSTDDSIHMMAIPDTYDKNSRLDEPFQTSDAIQICDVALEQYMLSMDDEKNEAARKRGYPGAGLNYTDEHFFLKLGITDTEIEQMKNIRRDKP